MNTSRFLGMYIVLYIILFFLMDFFRIDPTDFFTYKYMLLIFLPAGSSLFLLVFVCFVLFISIRFSTKRAVAM